ncbi:hypothetical protein BGZ94_000175 [Podila epigama]|nr:hypothetical protein BGZ94_000175 [Podila epigama]
MADEKLAYETISKRMHHQDQPQHPISVSTTVTTTTFTTTESHGTSTGLSSEQPLDSPISPTKSTPRKTGTRSTFCPNTLRKGTRVTDEDDEHRQKDHPPQPTGWFETLCKKKSATYVDRKSKMDEPHDQSYY